MAHTYATKQWSIAGEVSFPDAYTLLNPTLTVRSVAVRNGVVTLVFGITENGGVFVHEFAMSRDGIVETDLNILVDDTVAYLFPEATVVT